MDKKIEIKKLSLKRDRLKKLQVKAGLQAGLPTQSSVPSISVHPPEEC